MTLDGLQAYSSPITQTLNFLPHPAWVREDTGEERFNPVWTQWFGGPPETENWTTVLAAQDQYRVQDLQERALRTGQGFQSRVKIKTLTGGRTVQVSFAPLQGMSGCWLGLLVELAEISPASEELQQFEATLHALRVSLANSLRREDVVKAILRQMQLAFQADGCILWLKENETTFQNCDPASEEVLPEWRKQMAATGNLMLLTGDAQREFTMGEPSALEHLQDVTLTVPLMIDDQLMGVLDLQFQAGPHLMPEQHEALIMHAEYLAIVLRRVQLFEAEKHARQSSEQALKQSQILQRVTSDLFRAETADDMAKVVLEHTFKPMGIQDAALFLTDPAEQEISLVSWQGMGAAVALMGKTCPLTAHVPAAHVAYNRTPLYLSTPEDAQHIFPNTMKLPAHTQMAAKAYLPLVINERTLGVLFVGFTDRVFFEEEHRLLLENLAGQVAQAVERSHYRTKEKQLIKEREETIARLNAILDNAPIGIGVFDQEKRFETVNPRLAEYHQIPVEDHLGQTLGDLYPGTSGHLMAAQEHVLRSGMPVLNIEATTANVTGQVQSHLISYFPVKTRDGRVLGVGTTQQNITERKQVEEALRSSEHFLKHINDTVPALVYVFSLEENRITHINPGFTQVTGLTMRDLQQKNAAQLAEMIHPEDRTPMMVQAEKVLRLKDGEVLSMEYRNVHQDGRWRWLHSTQTVFSRHADGSPAMLLGAALDITERKEAEMALRESEKRFQLVANQAPVMIWMGNDEYGATFFNTSWLSFRGRTLEQELGVGWLEGLHPEDAERCETVFREAHEQGTEFQMEYRLKRFDGTWRWVVDRGIPRFTETGEFRGFIGACIDIHDRKMAETVLQESEKRLRELMEAQKRFVADAAHELRTPLTAIQGNLDILIRYQHIPEVEKKEIIGDVQREATRLGRLVHDMLQLARGDSGATMREDEIDLGRMVLETWRETERVYSSHCFVLHEVQPVRLLGDHDRLKQVVLILLENALKYTPAGGEVHLNLENQQSHALLTVQDTGMGISAEDLPRVFERFYRADKSRHRAEDPGGTGLGLPIARWVVEAHQGRIWLESELDRGTTVHVQLPIKLEESS
ncbi:PAS domain S-box protein [Deinococcus cellulosilyticus]|uniref:histidine kinase n=1 Tax=Deinococcus cellulosilyticus (strain DSM 18568 / NBRC 106333 / KACC 11606 / 5516J-15) TaxID=1223518 RepID=A0A511MZL8_DEIC1|nr:PAS domain S-box protein [Deinococcus cellulosilyticus]GEM45999.1 hypothetical protein DC3_16340 [Deinococcus cellulosilyticus NBRC 106333 = KACC 11606]